jgi:uncharacterized membrane protein
MDRGYGMQQFPPPFRGGGFVEHVGGRGGPSDLAWVIFALLLVLLLLVLVSLALDAYYRSQGSRPSVKWLGPGPPGFASGGRALAVLGVRYARGEISRDDYLQARDDLGWASDDVAEAPTEVTPPPKPPARPRK